MQGADGSLQNLCWNNTSRLDAAFPSPPLPQAIHVQENQANRPVSTEGQMSPENFNPRLSSLSFMKQRDAKHCNLNKQTNPNHKQEISHSDLKQNLLGLWLG